jgi:hypothetical protein
LACLLESKNSENTKKQLKMNDNYYFMYFWLIILTEKYDDVF